MYLRFRLPTCLRLAQTGRIGLVFLDNSYGARRMLPSVIVCLANNEWYTEKKGLLSSLSPFMWWARQTVPLGGAMVCDRNCNVV